MVTFANNPIRVEGTFPKIGTKAPAFSLVDKDLNDVSLSDFFFFFKVLNIVPSLDTPVCAISTRKFNEEASNLSNTAASVLLKDWIK